MEPDLQNRLVLYFFKRILRLTLAGVAQWIGRQPANPQITGSIPDQDRCLGGPPGPQLRPCGRQPFMYLSRIDVSLPVSLNTKKALVNQVHPQPEYFLPSVLLTRH